jgi:2'-5' RNA ligase
MTLQFIGEVEKPEVADITAALSSVEAQSFDLMLSGVSHFGSHKKIRSLWAGIQNCPALYMLHKRIENVLTQRGIAPDTRKFPPI